MDRTNSGCYDIHCVKCIALHYDFCGALFQADLGVKTKTQLMAKKSVFKILLMTLIASSAEPDLHDPKDDFAVNVCHHFAMIFHIDYT